MANPLILHENIHVDADATLSVTPAAAAGFPVSNITDWRMGTAYRWKATSTASQYIDLDAGAGNTLTADTICVGGHNLSGATIRVNADATATPTTQVLTSGDYTATDNLPFLQLINSTAARYWRIIIITPPLAPQIGVITLGRRIDYEAGALPDLDPYQRSSNVEPFINNNGSPIGVNVRSKTKTFNMNYGGGDPGMTKTGFFAPAAGISFDDSFLPHAVDSAKPFWFAWNIAVDASEVYLCRIDGPSVSMPFVGTTARRGLQCRFIAHRETS